VPNGDRGEEPEVPPGAGRDTGDAPGDPRVERRSNELSARAYRVLAHCEPQIANALVRELAAEGIAAYAVPYGGTTGGYLEVHPPVRPLARVWVDAAAVQAARDLLDARHAIAPDPPLQAEDAAWQEIVASLRRSGPDGPAPWPTAENLGPRPAAAAGSSGGVTGLPTAPSNEPSPGALGPPTHTVYGGSPAVDPDDEHFIPPPPPPVPVPTGASAYGIAALIAGSLVLLVPTLAGDPVSPTLLVLAIAAVVGGFLTLVARMREGPPTDSDSDDGAVL
jgi:hypothetical protein